MDGWSIDPPPTTDTTYPLHVPSVKHQQPGRPAAGQKGEGLIVRARVEGAARQQHVEADPQAPDVSGVPVADGAGGALCFRAVGVGGEMDGCWVWGVGGCVRTCTCIHTYTQHICGGVIHTCTYTQTQHGPRAHSSWASPPPRSGGGKAAAAPPPLPPPNTRHCSPCCRPRRPYSPRHHPSRSMTERQGRRRGGRHGGAWT